MSAIKDTYHNTIQLQSAIAKLYEQEERGEPITVHQTMELLIAAEEAMADVELELAMAKIELGKHEKGA